VANVANLRINAVVVDQATPALKRINQALNGLNSGMSGTSGGALGAARALTGVGGGANMAAVGLGVAVAATAAFVAGTYQLVKASVSAAAEVESYRNTFIRLTGDATKADAILSKLQDFADWSPFDDQAVMKSAQMLLGAGVQAEDLTRVMTGLSDISGDSAETFGRATLAFSQMLLKGKVSQEELNQFAEAGIPAQKMLADAMGVSTNALGEMASKGQLVAKKVLPLLIDQIDKQFGGSTERASQSTRGLASTLDAKLNRSLVAIGKALEPLTKTYYKDLIQLTDDLSAGISALTSSQEFQDFLGAAGEAFKALLEVVRPVMTILLDLGRAVLPYLTIILKVIAVAMRLFGAALQAVARFLKPVWDYIRAVGNVLKAGLDWVIAWGAKLGDWPKVFAEARDWIVELLGWIAKLVTNPVATIKVLWDVAVLKLPTFADVVIKIAWNIAELILPAFKPIEILVKFLLSGFGDAEDKVRTLDGQTATVTVNADTQAATESMDTLRERLGSLSEPPTPWTFEVRAIINDAMDRLDALINRITDVTAPDWSFTITAGTSEAMIAVAQLASAISVIPLLIPIVISMDFGTTVDQINSVIASIETLRNSILSLPNVQAQVPTTGASTGPNPTGLSVPPVAQIADSVVSSGGLAAAAAGAALVGAGMAMVGGSFGGPGGCFTGDTRVWTANGLIRISEIVVGDSVEVYDPDTATVVNAPVCETLVHHDHPVWTLRIYGDVVSTTAEHPFLTSDGWKRADELVPGSVVITAVGRETVEESFASGTTATVYNLHVDHPAHTYLVGTARWVVHNYKNTGAYGASGAIVTQPTMALIGEKGPEALVPLDQMPGASPLGSFGGGIDTVIINVSGFADGASAGRAAADAFRRQLGLQRRLPFGTA